MGNPGQCRTQDRWKETIMKRERKKKKQIDIKTEKKTERRWTSQFFAKIPPIDVCIYGCTVIQIDGWVYGNTSKNTNLDSRLLSRDFKTC